MSMAWTIPKLVRTTQMPANRSAARWEEKSRNATPATAIGLSKSCAQ